MALPAQKQNPLYAYDDVPDGGDVEVSEAFKNRDRRRIQAMHAGELSRPQSGGGIKAEDEDSQPDGADQLGSVLSGVSPNTDSEEVSGRSGEDKISKLYRGVMERARAKSSATALAQTAASKAKQQAKKMAARLVMRILLNPYVLAALGVIIIIIGLTFFIVMAMQESGIPVPSSFPTP
ncbi:MAG: hypothetical protein U1C18_02675 [Patescibacteria group bacterium]|nr:hypothetical protein [Patescibacteria group bacterium]